MHWHCSLPSLRILYTDPIRFFKSWCMRMRNCTLRNWWFLVKPVATLLQWLMPNVSFFNIKHLFWRSPKLSWDSPRQRPLSRTRCMYKRTGLATLKDISCCVRSVAAMASKKLHSSSWVTGFWTALNRSGLLNSWDNVTVGTIANISTGLLTFCF